MSSFEKRVLNESMLEYSERGHRLFRNNVGTAWTGKLIGPVKYQQQVTLNKGDVVIRKARPFHSGMPRGSSDLIGWTRVEITPDMVGKNLAVFTAFEAKTRNTPITQEQQNFIHMVNGSGGIAQVITSREDIQKLFAKGDYKWSDYT